MDISTTKLTNLLLKVSRGRNGREKAELIKTAAQSSIGISYALDAFSFELKQLLAQIEFMENQLSDVDAEMEKLLSQSEYAVITTISGIGPMLGSVIVSEIGDINRFENSSKLVAYAGLDASLIPRKTKYLNAALRIYAELYGWQLLCLYNAIRLFMITIPNYGQEGKPIAALRPPSQENSVLSSGRS